MKWYICDGKLTKWGNGTVFEVPDDATEVVVPEGVRCIVDFSFAGQVKLKKIVLPKGLTTIGENAFSDCLGLEMITLPEGVESIGKAAFNNCAKLTKISLPDSLSSIGWYAFSRCTKLMELTLPKGVNHLESRALNGIPQCAIQVHPDNPYYAEIDGVIYDKSLTRLVWCPEVKEVISIPDSVTSIGDAAFSECAGLATLTLPEGVTSIGHSAFSGCVGLTTLTLPEGVTSIGNAAFSGCAGLASMTLPEGVTSIGRSVFSGCTGLTSMTFPGSLTTIGQTAFEGCIGLTSIVLPESVTSIGYAAFSGCAGLTTITLPKVVTDIGNMAFCGCERLTSVALPEGVTKIGEWTFKGCVGLTSIALPEGVTDIGSKAFEDCASLTSVALPKSLNRIKEDAFNNCRKLFKKQGAVTISTDGSMLKAGDSKAETCMIPDNVRFILNGAFKGCKKLASVTLHEKIKHIGSNVFASCSGLTNVTLYGEALVESDAFKALQKNQAFCLVIRGACGESCTEAIKKLKPRSLSVQDISALPAKLRPIAAVTFAEDGEPADTPRGKAHIKYIKTNAGKLITFAFDHPDLLNLMCREKLIAAKDIDAYMLEAEKRDDVELKAQLLDYQQNGLGADKVKKARAKKVEKQEMDEDALFDVTVRAENPQAVAGKTFAITGGLNRFPSRAVAQRFIEQCGAMLASTVDQGVDYLIANDPGSGSAKNMQAKALRIQVISEEEFLQMVGCNTK